MLLNVQDRILIPNILPKENSYLDYTIKRSIIQKVGLSQEDAENFSITVDEETKAVKWDLKKDLENPLETSLTPSELEYLKKACEKLSETPNADNFWMTVEKIYNER